jgi:glycine cleavage system regulatory protein
VESISEALTRLDGNWRESRLAHIRDQFAGILELDLPTPARPKFDAALAALERDFQLRFLVSEVADGPVAGRRVTLECLGQDRPGIVFAITDVLHDLCANVEAMDTSYQDAPMSGEQLFRARFEVSLQHATDLDTLEARLAAIGEDLMLDVQIGG